MKRIAIALIMTCAGAAALFAHGHWGRGWHDGWRRHGEGECYGRGRDYYRQAGPVPLESIPKAAQDFIAEHFPERTAQLAIDDYRIYKVILDDGTEIVFTPDGEWHDIESYMGVPSDVLPQEIADYAEETYPDIPIIQAEKDWRGWGGYELKLANRMEMYFDNSGRVLGQKFDD